MEVEQKRLIVFALHIVAIVLMLSVLAMAENVTIVTNGTNNTIGNQLNQISEQTRSFNEQIKAVVPYEVFEFLSIGLGFVVLFTKGGNATYGSMWKTGLYVALIAVVAFFLLTR